MFPLLVAAFMSFMDEGPKFHIPLLKRRFFYSKTVFSPFYCLFCINQVTKTAGFALWALLYDSLALLSTCRTFWRIIRAKLDNLAGNKPMKREDQTAIPCKQPIKIEKPLLKHDVRAAVVLHR